MGFGTLHPGASIGGFFRQLATVQVVSQAVDSTGMGYQTVGSSLTNIPCSLQPMSSTRSMTYKAENADSLYDLYLPLRREGQSSDLSIPVGTRFVIDSVTYRTIGEGVRQGLSGVQRVAVEEINP